MEKSGTNVITHGLAAAGGYFLGNARKESPKPLTIESDPSLVFFANLGSAGEMRFSLGSVVGYVPLGTEELGDILYSTVATLVDDIATSELSDEIKGVAAPLAALIEDMSGGQIEGDVTISIGADPFLGSPIEGTGSTYIMSYVTDSTLARPDGRIVTAGSPAEIRNVDGELSDDQTLDGSVYGLLFMSIYPAAQQM